jgi:hypothetical protein
MQNVYKQDEKEIAFVLLSAAAVFEYASAVVLCIPDKLRLFWSGQTDYSSLFDGL